LIEDPEVEKEGVDRAFGARMADLEMEMGGGRTPRVPGVSYGFPSFHFQKPFPGIEVDGSTFMLVLDLPEKASDRFREAFQVSVDRCVPIRMIDVECLSVPPFLDLDARDLPLFDGGDRKPRPSPGLEVQTRVEMSRT
jgi:hypothetical protein